jgi:DNA-binding protein HU-beta
MTKTEFIYRVCEESGLTKKDISVALNAMVDTITRALARGDKVRLVGFGTFEVHQRSARKGRNPQTGDALRIPARKSPFFRAGRALKKAVVKT